jgi:hypothetical protein
LKRLKRWLWHVFFRAEHLKLHQLVYSYNQHWRSDCSSEQRQAHLVEQNTVRRVLMLMEQDDDVALPHPSPASLHDLVEEHHP